MHPSGVRQLIERERTGEPGALEELLPAVYDQLRRLAAHYLRSERPGHTLAPTAVVHEAYLRLAGAGLEWNDRVHFLAIVAGVMRRVLTDHARTRNRSKRGAGGAPLRLNELGEIPADRAGDIVCIDEALESLAAFDRRKARVIELIYFGGLTYDETAAALEISAATVHRELRLAKAWLEIQLSVSHPQ